MADTEFFVSLENRFGQVTWSSFPSKAHFEKWYAGTMNDGSGELIRDVYPKMHYQGHDKDECARINNEHADKLLKSPEAALILSLASLGYEGLAEKAYKKFEANLN